MNQETEELRRSHMPDRIVMLLVGESAPAGGTFFYRGNSQAFRTISETFGHKNDPDFLSWFKLQGFYLDDLVLTPVDKSGRRDRLEARQKGVAGLGMRIKSYAPKLVVAIGLGIQSDVAEAVRLSGTRALFRAVHFPGNGQQTHFHQGMTAILSLLKL